ncbi:hypothetical protein [Micromonospora sp. C41]|uniref:hypothetical protein n=1 Tax=Micromonospora sp. C41 TaxID=2824878 RepID=UPI001B398341|nr:hypothetical protein [Micromonospora sp. C41]MBQ1061340.1 hypothetical protein [Micromonospora sp. C41]
MRDYYRHANPPPVPDGDTIPQPAPDPDPLPPVSWAERRWALLFLAITVGAIVYGTLR